MINLYFDTETTGLPFKPAPVKLYGRTHNTNGYPRLIQIAWLLTDGEDNTLSRHEHLVRPDGFSIPDDAAAVNGITAADAMDKGGPLLEVLHRFSENLGRADIIIGHNIDYDINVMTGSSRGRDSGAPWRDCFFRQNAFSGVKARQLTDGPATGYYYDVGGHNLSQKRV